MSVVTSPSNRICRIHTIVVHIYSLLLVSESGRCVFACLERGCVCMSTCALLCVFPNSVMQIATVNFKFKIYKRHSTDFAHHDKFFSYSDGKLKK